MTPKYYVKLDDGTVFGPVSYKKAQVLLERHGGHLYDEEAFFELVPTADEVKELLAEIESVEEAAERGVVVVLLLKEQLQKIRGIISSLSAKKLVTGEIKGGVLTLEAPPGVEVYVRDYDVQGKNESILEDEDGRSYSPCTWGA